MTCTLTADAARNLVHWQCRGHVTAGEMKASSDEFRQAIASLRPNFVALMDYGGLERFDRDSVPHLTAIMDAIKASRARRVIRIGPPRDKDIGLNILAIIHYRGEVPVVLCDTAEEAQRLL